MSVYLNTREAAAHLRLSASHLAALRVYGGGPRFAKIGKAVRYGVADLDAWMASKTVASTSEKVAVAR